jgi:mono/diheme cytochrome c family protein
MSKRTFIAFGLLVIVLAVGIPWLVFNDKGDAENGPQDVPASLKSGQTLFQINCGTCHTLYAAGTDGNYGPDLDELLNPSGTAEAKSVQSRVETAVKEGVDGETPGRMPAEILNEEQTKEVAEFVANTAGRG